jgi:hypothetical protein
MIVPDDSKLKWIESVHKTHARCKIWLQLIYVSEKVLPFLLDDFHFITAVLFTKHVGTKCANSTSLLQLTEDKAVLVILRTQTSPYRKSTTAAALLSHTLSFTLCSSWKCFLHRNVRHWGNASTVSLGTASGRNVCCDNFYRSRALTVTHIHFRWLKCFLFPFYKYFRPSRNWFRELFS